MTTARAGNVEESALCLISALKLDTSTPRAAAGCRVLAHFIDDIRALRAAYVTEES